MKFKGNERKLLIASGAVAMALIVILVSVLPTIDSRSVKEERQGYTGLSYQYEFAEPYDLEKLGFMVVGTSPLATLVEESLVSAGVNWTNSSANPLSPEMGGIDALLIDADWLAGSDDRIATISSLIARGLTAFVINGTADDLAALMPGGSVLSSPSTSSNSKGPAVRGIHLDPDGGPSELIEIDGDATDPSELRKAITSAVNWTANRDIAPPSKSTNPYPEIPYMWNLTAVHHYYSGDALEPYGRITFKNHYYDKILDKGFTSLVNPPEADERMIHYKIQIDPGWAVYGSEYRLSRAELMFEIGPDAVIHYAPHTIASGENGVNFADLMVPGKEHLSPAVWSFNTALSDSDMSSISSMGLAGWGCDYDPGAYFSGRSSAIEPGVTFDAGPDGVGFAGHISVTWAKTGLVSWDKHTERIELAGAVR